MAAQSIEASFTRIDTARGAEFTVIPAAKLNVALALFAGLFGCLLVPVIFAPYLIGAWLIYTGVSVLNSNAFNGLLLVVLGGAIGWFYFMWQRRKPDGGDRTPISLIVNKDGIDVGGKQFKATDIVELILRIPGDVGQSAPGRGYEIESQASYQAGANVGREKNRRSYALMARIRSSSEPAILVGRLTPIPGEALLNDVIAAMK